MLVGSLADRPVLARSPSVSRVITDQHESNVEIVEQLRDGNGAWNFAQPSHSTEVPWNQYPTTFQFQTLRRAHSYKLPRCFQFGRPLRHVIGILHGANLAEEAYDIRSVLQLELIDIQTKVTHVSIAIRIVISSTHIGYLVVVGPGEPIVIAMCDPEFEVIAGVRSNDPAGILGLVAELEWRNVTYYQFVPTQPCCVFPHLHQGLQGRPRPALICRPLIDQICAIKVITARLSGLTESYQCSLVCFEQGGYFEASISFSVGGKGDAGNVRSGVPGVKRDLSGQG